MRISNFLCYLFFFTPLLAEYPHVTFATSALKEHDKNFKVLKHRDFSRDKSCAYYHAFDAHTSHFSLYKSQDFRDYFTARGYVESEILSERCLYMFDEFIKYAQTYPEYNKSIEQIHASLKCLNIWQKAYYTAKGTYCIGLQKRIRFLYKQLKQFNDKNASQQRSMTLNYAEPVINDDMLSAFHAVLSEYSVFQDMYRAHMPSLSRAIQKRKNDFSAITKNIYSLGSIHQFYNLNQNVQRLLENYEYDIATFNQYYGTQLQQIIHQESLDLLNHIGCLSSHSLLYDHQEALVDLIAAVIDYNYANMPNKAMHIVDLCWMLFDYGQAIAEGIGLGVYSAAHDVFTNPIEATVSIIAGKQILAFQLCKIFYNIADISATAITNFDEAKEKWNKYTEHLNDIIAAIADKEITVRDAIKGGTAFIVGYKAQGKLLGGLGKFCNTIKQKSIKFVKNSPLLNCQDYLTTPEGLLLQTIGQTKKDVGKIDLVKIGKIVEDKIAKINTDSLAVLRNGYYEVNGFRFTEYYYNRLWTNGRKAPSLIAKSILENAVRIMPDPKQIPGFFRYLADGWEMIYNPTTKVVSHLQPLKNFK